MFTPARTTQRLKPQRQTQNPAFSSTAMASHYDRQSAIGWLLFWLPIALIVVAVLVSHTSMHNADADVTAAESVDLVEAVNSSNPGRRLVFPAMAVLGLVLWQSNRRSVSFRPQLATAAILLIIIVGASVLWSVESALTVRRASVVFCIAMAALGIGRTWTAMGLCRAALIMSSFFVCISILVELKLGTFLQGYGYRFSGVFHPNRQGVNTSVVALSSLCLFGDSGRYRYLAVAVLGIALTKLTGSRGCMLGLVIAVAAMTWIGMSRRKRIASVIACGICLSIGLILFSVSDTPVPELRDVSRMGRVNEGSQDSLLNGRVAIWHECISDISNRPLLGYGYGAFWTSDRVFDYSRIHDWVFSSAHSVYLETALGIGIVGAMVALAVALIACVTSLRIFRQTRDWGIMFIFSLICMGLISGFVDVMFVQAGFVTILLAIGIAILSVSPLEQPGMQSPKGNLA